MPKSISPELMRRAFSTEPAEAMLETSRSACILERREAIPLEKYWKVPPSGPPPKPRRIFSAKPELGRAKVATKASALISDRKRVTDLMVYPPLVVGYCAVINTVI